MSRADNEAPAPPAREPVGELDDRDRAILDHLIEDAWQALLRTLRERPKNDNG